MKMKLIVDNTQEANGDNQIWKFTFHKTVKTNRREKKSLLLRKPIDVLKRK